MSVTPLTSLSFLQTCLRESDGSDEEDSLSNHSEDGFSEGSWDRVERKDTEVSRSRSLGCCAVQLMMVREFNQLVSECTGHQMGAGLHGLSLLQLRL